MAKTGSFGVKIVLYLTQLMSGIQFVTDEQGPHAGRSN
jgi:hypothetical protein